MTDCKYCKEEISNRTIHLKCSNEELKEINKSNGKDIPCNRKNCTNYEKLKTNNIEVEEKWKQK